MKLIIAAALLVIGGSALADNETYTLNYGGSVTFYSYEEQVDVGIYCGVDAPTDIPAVKLGIGASHVFYDEGTQQPVTVYCVNQ